jgi:hypothetical protein
MKNPHAKESSGSIEVGRTSGNDEARKEREQASLWLKGEGHFLYFQLIFCTRLIHRPDDEAARTSETSVYFNETTKLSSSYSPPRELEILLGLRVFQNRMLMGIFGPKRDEVRGMW